jgi:20S proteasome alpha/beta subunit
MTLGIAAKYKGGILIATDLALSGDGAKRHLVEGKWFPADDGMVLYAGTLYYAQEVQFAEGPLRERLRRVHEERKNDDDKDDAEFLLVNQDIWYYEKEGSFYKRGNYECIGSGADMADGLMDLIYTPGRSKGWLLGWMKHIFRIVNRKVDGVSADFKHEVVTTNEGKKQ